MLNKFKPTIDNHYDIKSSNATCWYGFSGVIIMQQIICIPMGWQGTT